MSTASDSKSTPIERSPLVRSVLPVETRSTMASASPRRGEISTEPATATISAFTPRSASAFAAMRGCEVAIASTVEVLDARRGSSFDDGRLQRAGAEAQAQQDLDVALAFVDRGQGP